TEGVGSSNSRGRSEGVRDSRVAEARIHVDDRCDRPAVQDCLAGVAETREVGVVDNARYELMTAVKRRQTAVSLRIERIEQSREARSKRRRTLRTAVVLRSRKRVAGLELQAVRQTT